MAGSNNFKVWNIGSVNQENDADYLTDSLRVGGAPTNALFSSLLANKLFYQLTMMASAIAQCVSVANQEALDTNLNDLANAIQATFGQVNSDWDSESGVTEVLHKPTLLSLTDVYPVGCIYTTTIATNPATVFGFGTWIAFGAGRVLVGVGTSDAAYVAGATGGESTHVLSTPETPAHAHVYQTGQFSSAGPTLVSTVGGNFGGGTPDDANIRYLSESTGGGLAHNNLQPYIVVYFWKRTA